MASGERSLIGRAFIVLGAFDAKSPRLTQSEISRRSGLPLPTVHRLCGQLVAEGALERRSDGKGTRSESGCGRSALSLPALTAYGRWRCRSSKTCTRSPERTCSWSFVRAPRLCTSSACPRVAPSPWSAVPAEDCRLHASSGGVILLAHGGTELLDGRPSRRPRVVHSQNHYFRGEILRATLDEIRARRIRGLSRVSERRNPCRRRSCPRSRGQCRGSGSRQLFRWSRIRLLYCRRWSRPPVEYHAGLVAVGFR